MTTTTSTLPTSNPSTLFDSYQKVMAEAFNRVEPRGNWKNPIDCTIEANEAELSIIREAVVFFTGSVPTFVELGQRNHYRVRAAGYYATIGA